jgi:hypothetical protein
MLVPGLLLVGGCSGLGHFATDTERLPGQNPNSPIGVSENIKRARGQSVGAEAIMPEPGNVWPGPPQPLPTLGDVTKGGEFGPGSGVLGGPTMPKGGSMSMGEQSAVHGGAPLDDSFSGAGLSSTAPIADPARRFHAPDASPKAATPNGNAPNGNGKTGGSDIVIPNGDGSSTVISPDGSVRTVKDTPK